jgi:hypothetical protein
MLVDLESYYVAVGSRLLLTSGVIAAILFCCFLSTTVEISEVIIL